MVGGYRTCRNLAWRALLLACAGAILTGCVHTPSRDSATTYTAQHPAEPYPLIEQTTVATLDATLGPLASVPQQRTRPINVLAVNAGGADAAFMAGAVVGWTQSGTRPTFDVVTGTSGGALVGVFAFLGPKYDAHLQRLFTNLKTDDLLHVKPLRYLPRDRALASSEPLERLIAGEMTESLLADLREAHAQGRRLFIGTTKFETKRQVVWDIGAITSSNRPEARTLILKILVASSTWAGIMPPVEICHVDADGQACLEHHIDGGATAQAFMRFGPMPGWPDRGEPAPGWLAGSNLYMLAGGKLYATPQPAPDGFFGRILGGVSTLTGSLARADMHRLHTFCLSSGMRFHLLAVPEEYGGSRPNLLKLDPAESQKLFDFACQLTSAGPPWRHTPPGAEPGEEEPPRGALAVCGSCP
jgi:hypothetical protein